MTETGMQLEDWLDDLCVRFIINLPEEDLSSVARICFQVEEAQWFYEDFIRPLDPSLPSMSLRSFCLRIFQHCPLLSAFSAANHMAAFEEFLLYKTRVPVRGAIMLNQAMDSVVLVKGWKKGANWSFPRGKINKDEGDLDCAIREVHEETGYDIREAGLVPPDEEVKYIEITMREQHMRLYVFRDVPMDTHFEPRTRKEISKIQWYRLSELPAFRKKGQLQSQRGGEVAVNANKFYMVAPFLVPLKKWVVEQKKRDAQRALNHQHLIPTLVDDTLTEEESGIERINKRAPQLHESTLHSLQGLDTIEGATAALHRLLKIQPPTQGLQPEAASAIQLPASKNSGVALLALLQGKSASTQQNSQQAPPSRTSQDRAFVDASIPKTPSHEYLIPQHPSNVQQSSSFASRNDGPYSHQSPQSRTMRQPESHPSFWPNQISDQYSSPRPQGGSRQQYQPQQLQHPQPLPPQVQRTLFIGDQAHGPLVPQYAIQQLTPPHPETISLTVIEPQFPNVHGPLISPVSNQHHSKLTSHSLTLLNTFKNHRDPRDQATMSRDTKIDIPPSQFMEVIAPTHMPELSADENQQDRATPKNMSGFNTGTHNMPTGLLFPARVVPSDDHRKSLLSMFKTPSSKSTVVSPTVTITTTADIQQGSEASSSRQPSVDPSLSILPKPAISNIIGSTQPAAHLSSLSSPFKPTSILVRPSQDVDESLTAYKLITTHQDNILKPHSNNTGPLTREDAKLKADIELSAGAIKSFQPQILRRPHPLHPAQPLMPAELAASPTFPYRFSAQSSLDRQTGQPAEHKQALLSLFRTGSTAGSSMLSEENKANQAPERAPDTIPSVIPRSRVDSLASTEGDLLSEASSRRGSHATISAADKGFLLGYLDAITRGGDK